MARKKKSDNEVLDLVPIDNLQEEVMKLPDVNISERDKEELLTEISSLTQLEKPLTTFERFVVEKKALGWSESRIALELGVDENAVRRTLNKPVVKEVYNTIMEEVKSGIKNEIVGIYLKIIRDRVREIEEKYNGDFSKASKRDMVDLLMGLDSIMKEEEKKKLGTGGNVFVNILQQVIKD